jgi:glycosyltransferase involved in cell wall biosynthesis
VLESFGDRLCILEHPGRENRGQSAGINLALASSDGDYVGILDSDDLWLGDKIAEQVAYLEAHPEVGLVYGNGEAVDEHGRRLYDMYRDDHREANDPCRVLLDCYFLVPNNALIRRSVLERTGGFDESLRAAQDHDMAVRIAEVTRLAFVNRKWFQYRRHTESISRRNADLRWLNGFRILDKARRRYPYPPRTVRGRRGVLHFRIAQCQLEQRRLLRAGWHLLHAFFSDPARALGVALGRERAGSPH